MLPNLDFNHGRNSRLIFHICVLLPVSPLLTPRFPHAPLLFYYVGFYVLLASLQIVLLYSLVYSCMTLL